MSLCGRRRAVAAAFATLGALAAAVAVGGSAGAGPAAPPTPAQVEALSAPPTFAAIASQRIYFVMPDRYANGDPANDAGGRTGTRAATGLDRTDPGWYHGGDLAGLAAGLDRIKGLGFTALWVTPVLKQRTVQGDSAAYHGYWGLDFTTVDPHLGSDADFAAFVEAAHARGLAVYLDVVVNHTADVVQLNGSTYSDLPYRDCRGRVFLPARYVFAKTFPCLKAANMPRVPFVPAADKSAKRPAWLNDPLNYHDRGNIDFEACSDQCYEQGDFFGLDDLFTEKPNVASGLAQVYGDWIRRFHVDGFRVDTARHVNAAFFRLWVPKITAAARAADVRDFQIFGEVSLSSAADLAPFVRNRGLPNVLDFPLQNAAANYVSGAAPARAVSHRLEDDDYFRTANGVEPTPPTFLGNHDLGRAAQQIKSRGGNLAGSDLLRRVLLGYDLLYLLRGAPTVYYGDEVGMIGTGGDKAARQDMFPTAVRDWQTEERVGSPPIGTGSSLTITDHPIQARLRRLAALRDAHPALARGSSIVRLADGQVLVVSRVDSETRHEYVAAFNSGAAARRVTVQTASPGPWTALLGAGGSGDAQRRLTIDVPAAATVLLRSDSEVAVTAPAAPKLAAGTDELTELPVLRATVSGGAPVTVAFAVRRAGKAWTRVGVDDSPPYRGYLDRASFRKRERVEALAIVRALDGKTAPSKVITVVPRP